MKLRDKVVLITGGAQGLSKAIALAMAREGAGVVICDINPKTLPGARAEVEAAGARCLAVECDVSSVDSVAGLFRQTVSTFGTLDVLVNNAALVQSGARNEEMRTKFYRMLTTPVPKESLGVTRDFPDEEWHRYWGVNVHGVFYCTREALRIIPGSAPRKHAAPRRM
jgi:3-oxoacyl-[acyl-carrier protein] reductase